MVTLSKDELTASYDSHSEERIRVLRRLQVLDSQYETIYQSILEMVCKICEVPVALITFAEDKVIWIKSGADNPDLSDLLSEKALCEWVVTNSEFLEISDITTDGSHALHHLTNASPGLPFYAGAPIKLPAGEVIGTICVFDTKPRDLLQYQRDTLIGLSDVITKALVVKNFAITLDYELGTE